MSLSILWRIMEIEEDVIRRGRRPRRITPPEISIIFHKYACLLPIFLSGILFRNYFWQNTLVQNNCFSRTKKNKIKGKLA